MAILWSLFRIVNARYPVPFLDAVSAPNPRGAR
jgi:hypothetical protein